MRDFSTGSIWRHLLAFSWPMFVGNLLQALYSTVDSFWVGRYVGPEALGAVSISFPVTFILMSMILGLTMATTTLVAQYRGAEDHQRVRKTVANALLLIGGLSLASVVIGILLRVPILRLIRTPESILEPASLYLKIFLIGLFPGFLYNLLGSILRGLGDSRTPLRFLVYATVLNTVLDPLLIVGVGPIPAMGLAGAAWATVASQTLSAVLSFAAIVRSTDLISRNLEDWKISPELVGKVFGIGVPAALQSTIVSSSMLVVATLVNTFGATVVAAFGAAGRLDQFAFLPAMSVSLAVSALVGQNLGAGKRERVREIVWWSSGLTVSITGVISLVALFAPTWLIRIFTDDPGVLEEGARYLRIVGLNYVPLALMFIITGVLRGAGDTLVSMLISFFTLWVIRVPLAWGLSYGLGLGVIGTWWSIVASTCLGLLLNWLYYRTGKWQRRVVVASALAQE